MYFRKSIVLIYRLFSVVQIRGEPKNYNKYKKMCKHLVNIFVLGGTLEIKDIFFIIIFLRN